jgi:DNA-binding transcriptional regulator GbsR (MarR family)
MDFKTFLKKLQNEHNKELIESVVIPAFELLHESEEEEMITSEELDADIEDTAKELEVKKEISEKLKELEDTNGI